MSFLRFFRKREDRATPRIESEAQSADTAVETGTRLQFTEPPAEIHPLVAASDYLGALAQLESLDDDRSSPELAYWQALCLTRLERYHEAEEIIEHWVQAHPDIADLHYANALLQQKVGRLQESEDSLSLALHYAPGSTRALTALGDAKQRLGDTAAAIEYYAQALDHGFDIKIATALARSYCDQYRYTDAEPLLREALATKPQDPALIAALGRLLTMTDRYEEAIEIITRITKRPDYDTQANPALTYAHYCLGQLDQARYFIHRTLAREPKHYEALFYLGLIELAQGDFASAWDHYRWRFLANFNHGRHYAFQEWDGAPAADKHLLVYGEQGLGDQIMFAGCIPEILNRRQRTLIECDERLVPLFTRSFPQATVVPWAKNKQAPWLDGVAPIDYQIAMGDLPGLYRRSFESFPNHGGYLHADPAKVAKWRRRIDDLGEGRAIGISWRGGSAATRRGIRSIEPEDWGPLVGLENTLFVSLQYGEVEQDIERFREAHGIVVHHWSEAIADYDETAALVQALDGVATVCTAVAHLTGALGQTGWVATPVIPEWRYMIGGNHWVWYPQIALIRQQRIGQWDAVLMEIASHIRRHCQGHRA